MDILSSEDILLILDKLDIQSIVELCKTHTRFNQLCKTKEVSRLIDKKAEQLVNPSGYNIKELNDIIQKKKVYVKINGLSKEELDEYYKQTNMLKEAYHNIIEAISKQIENKNFDAVKLLINREVETKKSFRIDQLISNVIEKMSFDQTIDVDSLNYLLDPNLSDDDSVPHFIEYAVYLLVDVKNLPLLRYLFNNYYIPSNAIDDNLQYIREQLEFGPYDHQNDEILEILMGYQE